MTQRTNFYVMAPGLAAIALILGLTAAHAQSKLGFGLTTQSTLADARTAFPDLKEYKATPAGANGLGAWDTQVVVNNLGENLQGVLRVYTIHSGQTKKTQVRKLRFLPFFGKISPGYSQKNTDQLYDQAQRALTSQFGAPASKSKGSFENLCFRDSDRVVVVSKASDIFFVEMTPDMYLRVSGRCIGSDQIEAQRLLNDAIRCGYVAQGDTRSALADVAIGLGIDFGIETKAILDASLSMSKFMELQKSPSLKSREIEYCRSVRLLK